MCRLGTWRRAWPIRLSKRKRLLQVQSRREADHRWEDAVNLWRRAFGALVFGLLCGASFTRAQGRVHRIGYLSPRKTFGELDAAFVLGMQELGYVSGQNLAIEYRWAANDLAKLPALAEDLVRLQVELIVTATTAGTRAAMSATRTIPIVMAAAADPVPPASSPAWGDPEAT